MVRRSRCTSLVVVGDVGHFTLWYRGSYVVVAYNTRLKWFRIDSIEIEESERGKGLGSALIGIVEDFAKALGVRVITTSSSLANGFWRRLGYEEVRDSEYGISIFVKHLTQHQ